MANWLKLDLRIYMLCLLIALAIIGMFQQGILLTLPQVLIAVLTTTSLDLFIHYKRYNKIVFPGSAFITGMIIALVLSPQVKWFVPLIASLMSIIQKYIIRYKGKHIFNPANFGLLCAIFIFRSYPTWWGQSFWPLIVIVGIFICYKMKRLNIPLVFIGSFVFLFILNNLFIPPPKTLVWGFTKQHLIDSFFLINIFFVFVMLIEPKTSPITKKGQRIYAILAALFSFVFFKLVPQYDFSILALACTNIFVPFLNRLK